MLFIINISFFFLLNRNINILNLIRILFFHARCKTYLNIWIRCDFLTDRKRRWLCLKYLNGYLNKGLYRFIFVLSPGSSRILKTFKISHPSLITIRREDPIITNWFFMLISSLHFECLNISEEWLIRWWLVRVISYLVYVFLINLSFSFCLFLNWFLLISHWLQLRNFIFLLIIYWFLSLFSPA